jgi:hypothetical protein
MTADRSTERIGPPLTAGERETLRAFLDYQRATLAMKCDGLSDDDLRRQSMPPSTPSLLGLVRHMAEVDDARAASRSEAYATWEAEVGQSRRIEANAPSLDVVGHQARWDQDVSLPLVMIHVLLEYARHNGHADFLRESIDGIVGA